MQALLEIPYPTNELRLFYGTHKRAIITRSIERDLRNSLGTNNSKKIANTKSKEFSSRTCQSGLVYRGATSCSTHDCWRLDLLLVSNGQIYQAHAFLKGINSPRYNPPLHNGKKKQSCVHCKGDHFPSMCEIITAFRRG